MGLKGDVPISLGRMPGINGFRGEAEVSDFQASGEIADRLESGAVVPAEKKGMGQDYPQE